MGDWGDASHIAWNGAWLLVWVAALTALWGDRRSLDSWRGGVVALGVATVSVGYRGYWLPVGALAYLATRRLARQRAGTVRT
ncbi:MAG TPA: hypothetical protein VM938_11725 [Acidimicrobiales bacterium]|nr:hypothetical protein [Acidimicrobiales bacterium]